MMISFIALIALVSCKKEEKSLPDPKATELSGPDVGCKTDGITTRVADGLRQIVFGEIIPNSISVSIVLSEDADLVIFAEDCCVLDDVVEIWIDGCLLATVDSRIPGYITTHTISLRAGTHVVTYNNIESSVGPSGWNVSETLAVWTGVSVAGFDNDGDGIPNCSDPFPNSKKDPFFCNSTVPNMYLGNGTFMMDLIAVCKLNAKNHGAFVSCVSALTNTWKTAGLITSMQKEVIMSCIASTNNPN